jgi:ankyrin repeat protein
MCGVITTYLFCPHTPGLLSSYPVDDALQAISKVISLGANLSVSLRGALSTRRWYDVKWLLERGARPDIDALAKILVCWTNHYTAEPYRFPQTNVYKSLIDQGADVNAYIHSQGWVGTPIIAASIHGDLTLAQLLVDAGAEVEVIPWAPVGTPPIKYVPPEEHQLELEILTYIRLNRERAGFGTALIEASARGHAEICRLIVKHSAAVHVHTEMEPDIGRFGTPLIAACAFNQRGICRILLGCGVDVTTISWRVPKTLGQPLITNALITAASCGGLEICRLLLCQGADINVIIPADNSALLRSQCTALIAAASYGHKDVCQLLLDHGAKVDEIALDAKYPTALIAAASRNKWKVCQLLLDCGADVNLLIPNVPYCNALIAACRLRKLRSIEVLVARGAELNIDPSTGVYAEQLLAACMGFDARRAKVIALISFRTPFPSLETNRVNEEALNITRGRLKAASFLISIDMKNKRDFSQVQDELQRKLSALTDDQLIEFFDKDDLQALLEVIYDPLLITKRLRRITQQALKKIAPRMFLLDRQMLKELFEKFPLFAADLALAYTEELRTGKLVSSKIELTETRVDGPGLRR